MCGSSCRQERCLQMRWPAEPPSSRIRRLCIVLTQPSPCWLKFGVRGLACFAAASDTRPPAVTATVAPGPSTLADASPHLQRAMDRVEDLRRIVRA